MLLFMGSERVRHDLAAEQQRAIFTKPNGGGGGGGSRGRGCMYGHS